MADRGVVARAIEVQRERERRARVARNYVPFDLHPKQRALLALPHRMVLYGGAAGGGKTEALAADFLQHIRRPGYSALILRRSFRALNLPGSIMHRMRQWVPEEFWSEQEKRFTFPTSGKPATIQFGYCDHEHDLSQYQSAEFHKLGIDELTEWPEGWATFLMSRVRRKRGDDIPTGFRAGTNPGGIGGEWVRERWGIPEGVIVEHPIENGNRYFLPARAEDNPTLDLADYEESLKELSAAKYEQLRWGRWVRDGEGFVYSSWSSANLLRECPDWIAPGKVSALLAQDYGVTNDTSFNILAWREHDPCVYVVRSWKLSGLSPSENAEIVQNLEREWHFEGIVGDVGGLGKAFAEEASKRFSLPIQQADKNNKRGYIELLNGELKRLRVLIVESGCAQLVHEYKTLPWAENRLKEADGFANHCADGVLYGWRATTNYHEVAQARAPRAGTPEHAAVMAEELERLAVEDVDREEREEPWG